MATQFPGTSMVRVCEIDISISDPAAAVATTETYPGLTWNPNPAASARHYATVINSNSSLVFVEPPGVGAPSIPGGAGVPTAAGTVALTGSETAAITSQPTTEDGGSVSPSSELGPATAYARPLLPLLEGEPLLTSQLESGRGAMLLGAHMGSFEVMHSLDAILPRCDVLNLLRIQFERQRNGLFPSIREYRLLFGMDGERMKRVKPDVLLLAPGPINRGVEITPDAADGANSAILDQVAHGVAVRMAVLSELCKAA